MRQIILVTFISVLSTFSIAAQEEFLIGELYDSQTNEPIPFATIRVKGYAVGVISNMDGGFKIPLKFKEYGEVLQISSMGYLTTEISISDLSIETINVVRVAPGVLALNEVVVNGKLKLKRNIDARQIVERAIKEIVNNYPKQPFSMVGYYRDYQYENSEYLNLNEAILEVYDKGFGSIDSVSTQVLLFDFNENNDFYRDTLALEAYDYIDGKKVIENAYLPNHGGNEFSLLRVHDAVRNYKVDSYSFIHRFETDLLSNHSFSFGPDTYLDGENLYTIPFVKDLDNTQNFSDVTLYRTQDFTDYSAYGILYISKKDFAIHKLEYSVYNKKRKLPKGEINRHGENSELVFEVKSEYQRVGERMYLNYISFYNTFQIRQPPKFKIVEIIVDFDKRRFVITFNNALDVKNTLRNRNYEVTFKDAKLKIDKIVQVGRQVILFPKLGLEESQMIFNELRYSQRDNRSIDNELLSFKAKNILDTDGNKIHEWSYKVYHQFREFFVQEVKPETVAPLNLQFMFKNRPMFQDQPVTRPVNFDRYWMNTPLQQIEQ